MTGGVASPRVMCQWLAKYNSKNSPFSRPARGAFQPPFTHREHTRAHRRRYIPPSAARHHGARILRQITHPRRVKHVGSRPSRPAVSQHRRVIGAADRAAMHLGRARYRERVRLLRWTNRSDSAIYNRCVSFREIRRALAALRCCPMATVRLRKRCTCDIVAQADCALVTRGP